MDGGTTASALQPQVPGEGAALLQVVLTLCGAAVGRSGLWGVELTWLCSGGVITGVSSRRLGRLPSFLLGQQNKIPFIAGRIEEIVGS